MTCLASSSLVYWVLHLLLACYNPSMMDLQVCLFVFICSHSPWSDYLSFQDDRKPIQDELASLKLNLTLLSSSHPSSLNLLDKEASHNLSGWLKLCNDCVKEHATFSRQTSRQQGRELQEARQELQTLKQEAQEMKRSCAQLKAECKEKDKLLREMDEIRKENASLRKSVDDLERVLEKTTNNAISSQAKIKTLKESLNVCLPLFLPGCWL